MIRFLLAQINTRVGDVEGNLRMALDAHEEGRRRGCDMVIYPEQTFAGYPAKDLLLYPDFLARCADALERFAAATANGPAALVGHPQPHNETGARLYNTAVLCRDGRIDTVYRKSLLPTYDVFDEARYFDSANDVAVVDFKGLRLGITVCEDLWNDELYWSKRRYVRDPIAETVRAGAQVLLNISASPFTLGKRGVRRGMMEGLSRAHKVAVLQVNLVGGNDDIVFDGVSTAWAPDGSQLAQCRSFDSDLLEVTWSETDGWRGERCESDESTMEELRRALVLGIRDYVRKCGFKGILLGLSGGIDSALIAALAAEALGPENVHGVSMPSRYSSDHSVSDAELLAQALGIKYSSIPIEPLFAPAMAHLEPHLAGGNVRIASENMQSRLRGLTLMALSNASGALVLTTGNKSELSVGYCTLYGDMCGGLGPIADVPKMMVYELSHHLNASAGREVIPRGTLEKPPSAELAPDQKDTDSLPPYDILDPIVRAHVEESLGEEAIIARGFEAETVRRVLRLIRNNEYKRRQAAPALKVTSRAFGYGWRMPIARG